MLDKERILRRLSDIEYYNSLVGKMMPKSFNTYKNSNPIIKAAAERYLQLISDIEFEILVQIYKGLELGLAGDEGSLISKIESKLGKKAIDGFKRRRTLRNMLVHMYHTTDYDKDVFEQAINLDDVGYFIKDVKNILSNA